MKAKMSPKFCDACAKRRRKKNGKKKKEKSNSIVGGRACNEGWQIGKRAYYCHLLNNQNVSLLPSNSPPIFFSFLRLPDEIRFFLASNFVFFLFCFLFLIRQKTKEEKKMYLFLIDFLVNWHHIPRCIASLMLDYRFGWRQNYLFR